MKTKKTGFLYKTDEGLWILSPTPNLKSCCVNLQENRKEALIVQGEFLKSSPSKAVSIEGVIVSGILTEAKLVEAPFPMMTCSLIGLLCLSFLGYKCRKLLKKSTFSNS